MKFVSDTKSVYGTMMMYMPMCMCTMSYAHNARSSCAGIR